ncbi:MAG: NAD-dependent succinate-semialdehyde dehydrogenase [Rhizobiaceae bacterium]|nr:NAD-dependent succinate-semialdehyde dehydrogenase [Rhizobiaceae bacterium]
MLLTPELRIGARRIAAHERETMPIVNPATGEHLYTLPVATDADLDDVLEAAERGFRVWSAFSAYDRARVLHRAAGMIRDRVEEIARALTSEQGKAIAEARIEVSSAADTFEWYAEEGKRAYGRIVAARDPSMRWLVTREPVGPVAAFSPWNFPAMLSARKIAGALAAGCSCVIKPAEETPTPTLAFAAILEEAGLPADVLSVVTGRPAEISSKLIASPVIRKISFTGSIPVGRSLAALAGQHLKKITLELGGHAPTIVFDDADLERAVETILAFKLRNAGQMCISPTRIYVQDTVHDRFTEAFARAAEGVRVGNGLDEANRMGALVSTRRMEAVERLVADALDKGASLRSGGRREGNAGLFYRPTVLADVPANAAAMTEEPFGPVALVNRFETMDEVVEKANSLPYGLSAYAFTTGLKRAREIGRRLEAGVVGVNNTAVSVIEAPFGGVKDSGYGSESGSEGLDAFLVTKFISEAA